MSDATALPYYQDGGLSALLYDFIETGLIKARRSVCCGDEAFYLACAAEHPGPVLEVGTGTGRIAWALARAGYDVVGVDLSAAMLRLAEEKRAQHDAAVGARAHFIRQNVTALDLGRRYNVILVPYRTLNHLVDPAAWPRALSALRRHLAPGGLLALHLLGEPADNPAVAGSAALRGRLTPAGIEAQWRIVDFRQDRERQHSVAVIAYRVFAPDGTMLRESREILTYRWAPKDEMRRLFQQVGLVEEKLLERFPGAPGGVDKEQIWLLRPARID